MITEKHFATHYSSFWADLMPMADQFIRRENMQLEREWVPFESSNSPDRNALINELAFRMFKNAARLQTKEVGMADLEQETIRYVARFENKAIINALTQSEREDATELCKRLKQYFSQRRSKKVVSPPFSGCGILGHCNGDVISGNILFEIKAGNRKFRLIDLRQAIIYCALNFASNQYALKDICLLNPRAGTSLWFNVNSFSQEVSGLPEIELYARILDFVSVTKNSR